MSPNRFVVVALMVFAGQTSLGCRMTNPPTDEGATETGADMGGGGDSTGDSPMSNDLVMTDGTVNDVPAGEGGTRNVTIRQVQDIADSMHPPQGSHIALNQSGMVALTPRLLIGSANGDSSMRCRFAAWIGDGRAADFSGVQVQELINLGDAGSCFDVAARRIPADLAPGDMISIVGDSIYDEFCSGPSGVDSGTCRDFSQTQLFGPTTFTRTGTGAAPAAAMVTVADLVAGTTGTPGPRAVALEGVLVRINNVRVRAVATGDGGAFTEVFVSDMSDTTMSREIDILVSNFRSTTCVRNYFRAQTGMVISFVTGILLPEFGRWKIRLRDDADVGGVNCSTPTDGGIDAASGG